MARRGREPKPAWLRLLAPPGNLAQLACEPCPGCGLWVIEQRGPIWDVYDAGILTGDDLTVAIMLDRRLSRIHWHPAIRQATLADPYDGHGLDPNGQYLTVHECGRPRVSSRPFKPPPHRAPPARMPGRPLTDSEYQQFTAAWKGGT